MDRQDIWEENIYSVEPREELHFLTMPALGAARCTAWIPLRIAAADLYS
jgi:hypothetical protein